ncbi:MAG TPA: hypothetical protein VJS30_08740 [Paraburkholderia sp.]|nr:hypothetical protein [Paraburkholderia sp.]
MKSAAYTFFNGLEITVEGFVRIEYQRNIRAPGKRPLMSRALTTRLCGESSVMAMASIG